MAERFKLRRKRIGSSQQHQPANRVNKFLSQAIEARSVDQEKAAHVNMFSLCFRDPEKERQVSFQKSPHCVTQLESKNPSKIRFFKEIVKLTGDTYDCNDLMIF